MWVAMGVGCVCVSVYVYVNMYIHVCMCAPIVGECCQLYSGRFIL